VSADRGCDAVTAPAAPIAPATIAPAATMKARLSVVTPTTICWTTSAATFGRILVGRR
jgi:hypothetical protein